MYTITDLEDEINEILSYGNEYVFPVITATLHTPVDDIPLDKIHHLDIDTNYNSELSDTISIDFMFRLGDYRDIILKYKDTLEITISMDYTNTSYKSTTDTGIYNRQSILLKETNKGDKPIVNRYRFIPLLDDKKFKSSVFSKKSTDELNNDIIFIKGQCIDPIVIGLKQYIISGIYRDKTLETVMKGVLNKYLNKLSIDYETFKYKFNIIKPDNDITYDHIIIKSNSKLIKLPYLLQTGDYGVYNGDLNLYISKDIDNNYIINIYPLYDTTKVDTSDNNILLLYSSDRPSKSLNEVTYFKDNKSTNEIKMVVSDITIDNVGANKSIELGDGLFNVNPNLVLDNDLKAFNSTKMYFDNDTLLNKEFNTDNPSMISSLIDTNQDDNLFKYRSLVLKSLNLSGQVTMHKVDTRIFIPGMYLKYIYNDNDVVIIKRGMIQNVSTTFNIVKQTSVSLINFSMEM